MNFYKLDEKMINSLNIKETSEAYALEENNEIIGYGIILNNDNSKIEIFIKEEYRSNGYGKLLFRKMLEELKKQSYKEIKITFQKNNYRIKNIIVALGGLQLRTDHQEETYLVPII